MNIFYLHENPERCAEMHCDKHVVKMILETAQLLSTAHHEIDGLQFGIVDVPGHERFLKHMLAGAQGIDVVLMVVAADDGVMPQTEEHFDIIHLLGVENLIFVITKVDLVSDQRVAEVTEEIVAVRVEAEARDREVDA